MIAAFFARVWGRVWPYFAAVGAAVFAALAIWRSGRTSGRQEARIDQLRADASAREDSREAAAKIDRLDDVAVRDRARQRMRNDARR